MKVLFAGDWHGDEDWAAEVIASAAETGCGWVVQVGDFGFGFFRLGDDPAEPGDWAPRCPFARHVSTLAAGAGVRVVFIDGNHDNQVLLGRLAALRGADGDEGFVPIEDHLWWAPRGHRWTWDGVRFGALGGAYSIDRRWRTKGLDYWSEETTTPADVARLGPAPLDVLVSHDGPVLPAGFDPLPRTSHRKVDEASRAQVAAAVAATPPGLVVHGHWHHRYTAELPVGTGLTRVEGWPPTSKATTVHCSSSTLAVAPERPRTPAAASGQWAPLTEYPLAARRSPRSASAILASWLVYRVGSSA